MTIGVGGEAITAWFEDDVDLVMGGEEPLCLPGRLAPPHDFLPPPCRPVAAFDPVVEPLVGPVIDTRCLASDRLYVAAQLVGDDNPWLAKLSDQPCQKARGGLCGAACLNQNVERVAIGVDRAPQPMLHAIDRDYNLIHVPLVARARTRYTTRLILQPL